MSAKHSYSQSDNTTHTTPVTAITYSREQQQSAAPSEKLYPSIMVPRPIHVSLHHASKIQRKECMYITRPHHLYLRHMTNDVYTRVCKFHSCAQNGSQGTHRRKLQIFSAAGILEFMAIDFLELLPETTIGNENMVIIMDLFSNLTQATLLPKISSMQLVIIFLISTVVP